MTATTSSSALQREQRAEQNKAMGFNITPSGASILDLLNNPKTQQSMKALAGSIMSPDRMLNLCINAIKKTPKLKQCNPESLMGAMMASAALGLEPNTILQQAYLIPYERRGKNPQTGNWEVVGVDCNFQIGYRGFIALASRSDSILDLDASAICEGDHFKHMKGSNSFLEYEKALHNRGDMIGAYALCRMKDGAEKSYVMPLDEIEKVRSRSETYNFLVKNLSNAKGDYNIKKAQDKLNDTPWVLWYEDMAAKSAIKKLSKFLDLSPGDAFNAAAELDSKSDAHVIDMSALADPEMAKAVVDGEESPPAIEHQENELNQVANEATKQQEGEKVVNKTLEQQAKELAAKKQQKPASAKQQAINESEESFE